MEKYTLKRSEKSETFICSNCKREKTCRNVATSETRNKLCNACYGLLISRGEIEKDMNYKKQICLTLMTQIKFS